MTNRALAYANNVITGNIKANSLIKGACERFLSDLEKSKNKEYPFYYDKKEVKRAESFFEDYLLLSGGEFEAKPFKLLPWQSFVISNIYGWKQRKNDYRRFKKAYIETGKGSGKSPLLAGMALKGICADKEPRAEGYVIARTSDQSLVTFRSCVSMVEQNEELNCLFEIYGGATSPWQITYKDKSFLRRVSSDNKGRHSGPIPHIVIVDEYHEHENASMRDTYAAGVKNRRQPLVLIITNSGVSLKSPCGQEHLMARGILTGDIEDDSYFAMIFGVEDEDEPFEDESCWIKANPSICGDPQECGKKGVISIPGYDYIRQQVTEAKGMPSKKSVVNRLNFCRWVDAAEPWIDLELYRKNEVKELSPYEERKDKWCWMGLDLSSRIDLSAGCLVWDMGSHYEVEVKVWAPKDTLYQRSERESAPYQLWADQGYLDTPEGTIIDFESIARWIGDCNTRYRMGGIAYDPWRITYLEQELDKLGIDTGRLPGDGLLIVPHPQGFIAGIRPARFKIQDEARGFTLWMPRSIEHTEELILKNRLKIKINPVLRMAVSGCVVITDASENRRLTKTKSLTRIDPLMAMVMGVGAAAESRNSNNWKPIEDINSVFGG